jgi:hypothetical protein
MFGLLPASILYARHVSGLTLRDFQVKLKEPDERFRMILSDVKDASFEKIRLPAAQAGRNLLLNEVEQLRLERMTGLADQLCEKADKQSL